MGSPYWKPLIGPLLTGCMTLAFLIAVDFSIRRTKLRAFVARAAHQWMGAGVSLSAAEVRSKSVLIALPNNFSIALFWLGVALRIAVAKFRDSRMTVSVPLFESPVIQRLSVGLRDLRGSDGSRKERPQPTNSGPDSVAVPLSGTGVGRTQRLGSSAKLTLPSTR